jgi:hypothetical protein
MSKLVLIEQSISPTTPSTTKLVIYAKTDGKVYAKNDSGVEYDLTLTGGEDLAATLLLGNATEGTNIVVSDGDVVSGESAAGVAGDLVLQGGTDTDAGPTAGGNVVLVPGLGVSADDGQILLKSADELAEVALSVTGAETLQIGTTLPFIYDGTTGKLTIPGIIDPVAVVFEAAGAPATSATEGAIFVSDGSGGLISGELYYRLPSSGTIICISKPVVTLQDAYSAGRQINLSSALDAVVLRAGAAAGPTVALLNFERSSGQQLGSVRQPSAAILSIAGAPGPVPGSIGTTVEVAAGAATGPGVAAGGSVALRPGAGTGGGASGSISFSDPSAANTVSAVVAAAPTYPAPVLLSVGTGTLGMKLGPMVENFISHTFTGPGTNFQIPNNAVCVLVNSTFANCTVTLPTAPVPGQVVTVKDITPAARVDFNIVGGTIDGNAGGKSVTGAYWLAYSLIYNGSVWFII